MIKARIFSCWPVFVIVILLLIFFYPVFLRGLIPVPSDFIVGVYYPWLDYHFGGAVSQVAVKNPLLSDVPSLILPFKIYVTDQLKQGKIPIWNPYIFGGFPVLANFQSGVFYPLNIIYFFTDFLTGWTLGVISQIFLSLLGMYFLLRHFKLSKISSLFGGIVFGFCGFNLIWLEYNVLGHVAALIPWVFLFYDKYLTTWKNLFGVFFSLFLSFQIFAGYPQLSVYTVYFLIFWTFFRIGFNPKKLFSNKALFSFWFLAFLISAVQLIPGFELLLNSQRGGEGIDPYLQFLPFEQLITFFLPDYFGNPATYNFWGRGDYGNIAGYCGLAAIILAGYSLKDFYKKGKVSFMAILCLVTILLVLPIPILKQIHLFFLPGSSAARMSRLLIFFDMGAAFLGAFGLESLFEKINLKVMRRAFLIPGVFLTGFLIGTFISWELIITSSPRDPYVLSVLNNLSVSLRNMVFPFGIFGSLIILIWLYYKTRKKYILFFGIILITSLELFRFGWKYNVFSKKDYFFPDTPTINFLQKQKQPFRISTTGVIPMNMWVPYKLESMSGYDAIYPKAVSKFLAVTNTNNVSAEPQGRYGEINNYNTKFFSLTNTKYVLVLKTRLGSVSEDGDYSVIYKNPQFKKVFEDKSVVVLENLDMLERYFVVFNSQVIQDDTDILNKIKDENFDLSKEVILDTGGFKEIRNEPGIAKIDSIEYTSGVNSIKVESNKDGYLVVLNSYYPGWKAEVDGITNNVLKADFNFMAVPIGKGVHTVKLFYKPLSFEIGKWMSLMGLCLVSGILILSYFKRIRNFK